MHVRLSPRAQADIQNIISYIEPESPSGLTRILAAMETTMEQLSSFPFLGREGRVDGTREIAVPRTPFLIIYTLPDTYNIDVERILHGKQEWPPATS